MPRLRPSSRPQRLRLDRWGRFRCADVVSIVIEQVMEALMQPTGILENAKGTKNPLKQLLDYGQSMWLDYIRRDLFTTGQLKQMIAARGLGGMTSNPAIFEKAIADSSL